MSRPRNPLGAVVAALTLAAVLPFAAVALEPGGDVSVPEDLLAVLTLRGRPCDAVVSYVRQAEADYLVTCATGDRYRIFVDAGNRVVVEAREPAASPPRR